MNDDGPDQTLESLRRDHRRLDEEIARLIEDQSADQVEVARLKRQKLHLKDRIQNLLDQSVPDIIA